jgi:hypothetical protein
MLSATENLVVLGMSFYMCFQITTALGQEIFELSKHYKISHEGRYGWTKEWKTNKMVTHR